MGSDHLSAAVTASDLSREHRHPINLIRDGRAWFESGTGEDVQPTTFQACSIRRSEMLKTFGWRAFYQIDVKFA